MILLRWRYLGMLLLGSMMIAGCGASVASSGTPAAVHHAKQHKKTTHTAVSQVPATPVKVILSNGAFQPKTLDVAVGTSVTFEFDGMGTDHFLLKTPMGSSVQSPMLAVGQSWTYKFTAAGTYHIMPEIMQYIVGTVVVK